MEIIVEGKGTEYFAPDQVNFVINFYLKGQNYEETLSEGVKSVQNFIDSILLLNNFNKEDLKTRNFVIREETKYNELTKNYIPSGYSFNQLAILKFDYDKEKMANMMEQISKLNNAPKCQIVFGVKNEKDCRRKILSKAYNDAYLQAQAIAEAAGKTLKQCVKVDFKPFTTEYVSKTSFGEDVMYAKAERFGAAQTIVNTFTPEDIELTETLYCLWLAE